MVITVKDTSLKKKIFKQMNKFDDLALRGYKKGNLSKGRKLESRSDKLYSKNYSKIFKISKN